MMEEHFFFRQMGPYFLQYGREPAQLFGIDSPVTVLPFSRLGYIIGNGGIATGPQKIESIRNWPAPKNILQVRGFLGLAGWYRRFIAHFSELTFHITETLKGQKKFVWTSEAQGATCACKS